MQNYKVVIISGPSGSGKSSLCKELLKGFSNIYFSVSSTTRKIRDGEVDGVHYNFISLDDFNDGINNGVFLEYAKVHNHYYGTQKYQVVDAINNKKIVLFDIDIQGQIAIKKHYPNATSIFITTSNDKILESRLRNRATEESDIIQRRLFNAKEELKHIDLFDFLIINDDFNLALDGLVSIVKSMDFKNSDFAVSEILKNWAL